MNPWGWLAAAVLLLVGACTGPASAQPAAVTELLAASASPKVESPKVEEIAAADILSRADDDDQFIRAVVARTQSDEATSQQFELTLARQAASIQGMAERSQGEDLSELPVGRLESLRRHWLLYEREVDRTRTDLARATQIATEGAAALAAHRAAWQTTRDAGVSLAPPLLQRIDEVIDQIDNAAKSLSDPLGRMIGLRRKSRALSVQLQNGLATVVSQIAEQDRHLLAIDSVPLWEIRRARGPTAEAALGLGRSLAIEAAFARDYDAANTQWVRLLVAACALLLPLMFWLRRRASRLVAANEVSAPDMHALSRPWSAWLVLVALCVSLYNLQGPTLRQQAMLLLAWVPVLRLLPRRLLAMLGPWAYVSAGFYFLTVAVSLMTGYPVVYRSLLLALDLLILATLGWLILRAQRPAAAAAAAGQLARGTLVYMLLCGAAVIVSVAVLSNVLGNESLATMLTTALLRSSYGALVLSVVASVLGTLAGVLLARPNVARLTRRQAGSLLVHAAARVGRLAVIVIGVVIALRAFRIYRPLFDGLVAVLTHEFVLGVVSISLGSIVAFFGAAWIAFWVAKTVRLLLAEDILPALSLPRGVGNSISTLSYYGLLFVGLITALGVAGYEVKRLAIVFGALGVGIGFGLQDIVRNFVSGLILTLERPIQPGDTVEVAGMSGVVREIGMRATIVTTFDGAQVVVPNGLIVAEKLVNWTLVATRRRFDITVSTAFGTAPKKTIDLLVSLAAGVEGIAREPAPTALLTGLGGGTLEFNLRVWTIDKADWVQTRSALAVRIRDGLAEAGVVVPLPQTQVHIASGDGLAALAQTGPENGADSGSRRESANELAK